MEESKFSKENKDRKNSLFVGLIAILEVVIIVAIIGVFVYKPEPEVIAGEAEASEYRVSGKILGRVEEFFAEEGEFVHKGDTLVVISSPETEVQLAQAQAAKTAADAAQQKALKGPKSEQVQSAFELYQKAKTAREIAEQSYQRVQRLYDKGVVSLQKRDEAEALYKSAQSSEKTARLQYNMVRNGVDEEGKATAQAMVEQADGAIKMVNEIMKEKFLVAPIDGVIEGIFPHKGELVAPGAPVMSIVDESDMWFVFSIREDKLKGFRVGSEWIIKVPALGKRTYRVKVTHIKAMASYATWRATTASDQYDVRTFEVKARPMETIEGLQPGMTAIIHQNDQDEE